MGEEKQKASPCYEEERRSGLATREGLLEWRSGAVYQATRRWRSLAVELTAIDSHAIRAIRPSPFLCCLRLCLITCTLCRPGRSQPGLCLFDAPNPPKPEASFVTPPILLRRTTSLPTSQTVPVLPSTNAPRRVDPLSQTEYRVTNPVESREPRNRNRSRRYTKLKNLFFGCLECSSSVQRSTSPATCRHV